jgi:hypothetical protein
MNELNYVGLARKRDHGCHGLRYIHRWPTGAQELVFRHQQHATNWAEAETKAGRPTQVRHK